MINLKQNSIQLPEGDPAQRVSVAGEALVQKRGAALWFTADGSAWAPFAVGGSAAGMIVVDTIAELAAFDVAALPDGARASVVTVRDIWTLLPASGFVPDGITMVAAPDGRQWWRAGVADISWLEFSDWWIDEVNGDDENRGTVVGAPLRSVDELRRRIRHNVISGLFTINIIGDYTSPMTLDFVTDNLLTSTIVVQGVRTQEATAVLTAVTPNDNAVPTVGSVAFGVDVSAQLERFMVVEDGAAAGAFTYHLGAPVGGAATDVVVGTWQDAGSFLATAPAIGDTVGFYSLTEIAEINNVGASTVAILDCDVPVVRSSCAGSLLALTSIIRDEWHVEAHFTFETLINGCLVAAGAILETGSKLLLGSLKSRGTVRATGPQASIRQGGSATSIQRGGSGNPLWGFLEGSSFFLEAASACLSFYDVAADVDCIQFRSGGSGRVLGRMWGLQIIAGGSGDVIDAGAGCVVTYDGVGTPFSFAPNADVLVGGAAATIGTLPQANAANFAAIAVDA